MIRTHAFRGMQALALSFALGLALTAGFAATAQAQTKIRMVLNWKYEGPQGMFFLEDDRGYFKQEGLEVTFDQGNGSTAFAAKPPPPPSGPTPQPSHIQKTGAN